MTVKIGETCPAATLPSPGVRVPCALPVAHFGDHQDEHGTAWPNWGRYAGERESDDWKTTLKVPDGPKMLRETLCVAQNVIRQAMGDHAGWVRVHLDRLQRLIDECDRHRPLGQDGNHGDRHTPTCGCDLVKVAKGLEAVRDYTDQQLHASAINQTGLFAGLKVGKPRRVVETAQCGTCELPIRRIVGDKWVHEADGSDDFDPLHRAAPADIAPFAPGDLTRIWTTAEASQPPLQPVYDAVQGVIRDHPSGATDDYGVAVENARVWRAVDAALGALGIKR